MSSVITLLFAPLFLLLIHYFEFKLIVLVFILVSLILLTYAIIKKKQFADFLMLGIYLVLLSISYFYASLSTVKFIPVFTSMAFFTLFAQAAFYKKELIYKLTQKFYKKKLSMQEIKYLKSSDHYWALSIFVYMVIQIGLVFYASDAVWAIYSSFGWYVYFVVVLGVQVIYGKAYAIKVSS